MEEEIAVVGCVAETIVFQLKSDVFFWEVGWQNCIKFVSNLLVIGALVYIFAHCGIIHNWIY